MAKAETPAIDALDADTPAMVDEQTPAWMHPPVLEQRRRRQKRRRSMSKNSPRLAGGSVGVVAVEPLPAFTLPPSPPSASARVGPPSPTGTVGALTNRWCPPPPSADTPVSVPDAGLRFGKKDSGGVWRASGEEIRDLSFDLVRTSERRNGSYAGGRG